MSPSALFASDNDDATADGQGGDGCSRRKGALARDDAADARSSGAPRRRPDLAICIRGSHGSLRRVAEVDKQATALRRSARERRGAVGGVDDRESGPVEAGKIQTGEWLVDAIAGAACARLQATRRRHDAVSVHLFAPARRLFSAAMPSNGRVHD